MFQLVMNKPNIAGSEPNWLFNIDALTNSMNYKPVVAGNQSNGNAGTKSCNDAGKARMETVSGKDYILLPEEKKDAKDLRNEDSEVLSIEETRINQENDDNINSTNNINTASDGNSTNNVNAVNNDEDVGVEADMNNLDACMPISPIPTRRIHKDHPVEQIIGDLHSTPQTRRMIRNLEEHRIEAIRLFLAYALFKDFVVYQMDVKSAFFYGKIEDEFYVCQPLGFEDPHFPNRVYKVEKALMDCIKLLELGMKPCQPICWTMDFREER
ncbi:putative ribonuclease H-like domain-containing protein [Tanacetum coccineum]